MTDKYTLQQTQHCFGDCHEFTLNDHGNYVGHIYCTQSIANLLDKCLNQTSRAGSKTSKAKQDAAKRNIAKRWKK
jgi:hypothetical protein